MILFETNYCHRIMHVEKPHLSLILFTRFSPTRRPPENHSSLQWTRIARLVVACAPARVYVCVYFSNRVAQGYRRLAGRFSRLNNGETKPRNFGQCYLSKLCPRRSCLIQTHFHNCVPRHSFFCTPISTIFWSQLAMFSPLSNTVFFCSLFTFSVFLLPRHGHRRVALETFLITPNFVSRRLLRVTRMLV